MLPQHDDLEFDAGVVSIIVEGIATRLPGPVIARARMILAQQLLAGDGEVHGAFMLDYGVMLWRVILHQEPWGGYKLIFTETGCILGMDSGLVVYEGSFLDGITDAFYIDSPGNAATPSVPGTVHVTATKLRDTVANYHPWGSYYSASSVVLGEVITPPVTTLKPSGAFAYKAGVDLTTDPKRTILFRKKQYAQIFPSSAATGKTTRMFVQARVGRQVRDFKSTPPEIAAANWFRGSNPSNTAPLPIFIHGTLGYINPAHQSGVGIHIDSKYNLSLIAIDHIAPLGAIGSVDHGIRVTRMKADSCVDALVSWLRDPELGGAATQDERDRALAWVLAYTRASDTGENARSQVLIHTMSDNNHATAFYEDVDGLMTGVIGDVTNNGQNPSFPWTSTAGYGYKFSKDGRRAARVGFHAVGKYSAFSATNKRTNGDIEVTEHELTFDRNPDADETGASTPSDKELVHWSVVETQVNQVLYNTWDPLTGAIRGVVVQAHAAWTSDALLSLGGGSVYSRLLVPVPPAMIEDGIAGPDPAASYAAPAGVIPWYIIGYDDDDAYHRVDINATTNKWLLIKRAPDGGETPIVNDAFPDEEGLNALFDIDTSPVAWTIIVPLNNQECIYIHEIAPQSFPTTVYRYTPRDGITDSLSVANGTDFFQWIDNNYSHYDHQAAVSGVHAGRSSGYTSGGFDLSEDYDTASVDLDLHPWQYVFVGFE